MSSKADGKIHCQVQSPQTRAAVCHAEVTSVCSASARAATSGRGYLHSVAGRCSKLPARWNTWNCFYHLQFGTSCEKVDGRSRRQSVCPFVTLLDNHRRQTTEAMFSPLTERAKNRILLLVNIINCGLLQQHKIRWLRRFASASVRCY